MNEVLAKWRHQCPEGFDARVTIEGLSNGYAHCRYWGRCEDTVTESDLATLFAHPQFGARGYRRWTENGVTRFEIIRHLD